MKKETDYFSAKWIFFSKFFENFSKTLMTIFVSNFYYQIHFSSEIIMDFTFTFGENNFL